MIELADYVLISVGQGIEWGDLLEGTHVDLNLNKTIVVDPDTLQSSEPDIFAGGDVATGPKFAIDAIALGKEGAISIHRFVQPGQSLVMGRDKKQFKAFDREQLSLEGYDHIPRELAAHDTAIKPQDTFKDMRKTFTEEQVKKETERCLGCGACVTKCKFEAILVAALDSTYSLIILSVIIKACSLVRNCFGMIDP